MTLFRCLVSGAMVFSLVACGGTTPGGDDDDDDGTVDAGDPGADADPDELTRLLETPWTLPPGSETYICTRWTAPRDLYINEFYPVIPTGTHHTVVTVQDNSGVPDGIRECSDPFEGGPRQIYGTGAGSIPATYPEGVAIKVAEGQQIVLNLHLFNVSDQELSGVSAIDVVEIEPSEVVHEAQSELFGKVIGLTVAPGESSQAASCTISSELELFLVQPHMHQMGVHLTGTLTPAGGGEEITLFDEPYDFDAQTHRMIDPIQPLRPGDTLRVECFYENLTGETAYFGESSNDEMCFLGLAVYPANQSLCSGAGF